MGNLSGIGPSDSHEAGWAAEQSERERNNLKISNSPEA